MTWWSTAKRAKRKNENVKQGRDYLCCGRLIYFARNSNVHGLRFVVGEKRNILTRLFWLMVIGVSCAGLHVLLEAIMDTVSGATVNFTPNTLYLDWRTTFPAVTICEKYNYRKSLKRLTLLYPDLIEAQDFTRRKYLIDLLYGEGSCKDCEPCGTKIPCDVDWREMINSVHKSCPELLSRCSWNGELFDCCAKFLPVDSEKGMCFTLNTRQSQMSGSIPLLSSDRTTGPGELVFHALSDVEVSVHSVEELATNSLSDELVFVVEESPMYTTEYLFTIVEMENEKELSGQSVEFRECRYLHEQPSIPLLYAYQVYAHSACVLACETQRKFKACGCISPVRDIAYKKHYCNFTGLNCLVKYEESRKLSQVNEITCQDCLPSCEESELKRIHYRRYVSGRMSGEEHPSPPGGRVSVRMVALPTLRYKRNILRTSLDLVVSVGGIAGLFFGASLLSVVEAFYLICVKRRGQ